jgi:ribonucleoside-diphosphate reductase alpha chain
VAPTGTTSNIAGVEGFGIEPAFMLRYKRKVLLGEKKTTQWKTSSLFNRALEQHNIKLTEEEQKVIEETGSCATFKRLPAVIREVFVVSRDIQPTFHVAIQAAAQRWVDSGISKTVNMPKTATVADVMQIFTDAYQQKCKGITVYVDSSREDEPLSADAKKITV